jgi:hypothetical protein
MKAILKYAITLAVLVCIGLALLVVSAYLPQSRVDSHAQSSLKQLSAEKSNPNILYLGNKTYNLDNSTDTAMLNQAKYLNSQSPLSAALKNSYYYQGSDQIVSLTEAIAQNKEANQNYPRYWGGYRVLLRWELMLFNLQQIRQLLMISFLFGFAWAVLMIYRKVNLLSALVFVGSVILVNPLIVASSMTFSTDFLIMFAAVIILLYFIDKIRSFPWLFFIIGVVTMYLDFYTVPIITLGVPLIVLIAALQQQDKRKTLKQGAKLVGWCALTWLLGYGLMWLSKLTLVTLFTDVNGFANGFSSFAFRVGITPRESLSNTYNIPLAIKNCFLLIFDKKTLLIAGALFAVWALFMFRRKAPVSALIPNAVFLLIAALPLLWIVAASNPINIHSFFQYRLLLVFLCGVGFFFVNWLETKRKPAAG